MLHEVLLALTGHCGGIFKDSGDGIRVLEDLPFIHPSEVSVLNQLCRLGTHYRDFKIFIHKYGSTLSFQNAENSVCGNLHGLYIKSLCHGLEEVLQDYRQVLLHLEQEILADPHLPVSHLQGTLQEYQLLFPALASVLEQIKSHKAHGCYILDIVHKNSICGLPSVKDALNRILHVCHGVLFKQLCAWLLHGNLVDPYKEFFIQRSDSGATVQPDTNTQEEDDLGIMGVTGRQLQRLMNLSSMDSEEQSVSQFSVQADLLPVYIPTRVANQILFVGESVQMFENDRHKPQAQKIGSILKNREQEFAKDLHALSKLPDFNCMEFESLIDKIRTYVAEHLWVLVVQDSGLVNQIRIMKDFYLLGRGELYLAFIDQAQHLLKAPPTGTTEHDVNMAYQQSARNVLLEDENFFQHFHLTITTKTSEKKGSVSDESSKAAGSVAETGWRCLGLSCFIQWPLHIFFTPNILDKYNRIFRFLLAVKRTQIDLQSCWTLQMQRKKSVIPPDEAPKWQLRTHMMFLVDNLQYYLQVDVIESQFGILLEKINTTRDFEAVKLAHEQFLVTLLSQSFVHMKSVSSCLYDILDLCSTFSRLVNEAESGVLPSHSLSHLHTIAKNFQRQSSLLFKILSSVRSHNASPHLAQLLLRLDFNRYFSTAGGQLGSI